MGDAEGFFDLLALPQNASFLFDDVCEQYNPPFVVCYVGNERQYMPPAVKWAESPPKTVVWDAAAPQNCLFLRRIPRKKPCSMRVTILTTAKEDHSPRVLGKANFTVPIERFEDDPTHRGFTVSVILYVMNKGTWQECGKLEISLQAVNMVDLAQRIADKGAVLRQLPLLPGLSLSSAVVFDSTSASTPAEQTGASLPAAAGLPIVAKAKAAAAARAADEPTKLERASVDTADACSGSMDVSSAGVAGSLSRHSSLTRVNRKNSTLATVVTTAAAKPAPLVPPPPPPLRPPPPPPPTGVTTTTTAKQPRPPLAPPPPPPPGSGLHAGSGLADDRPLPPPPRRTRRGSEASRDGPGDASSTGHTDADAGDAAPAAGGSDSHDSTLRRDRAASQPEAKATGDAILAALGPAPHGLFGASADGGRGASFRAKRKRGKAGFGGAAMMVAPGWEAISIAADSATRTADLRATNAVGALVVAGGAWATGGSARGATIRGPAVLAGLDKHLQRRALAATAAAKEAQRRSAALQRAAAVTSDAADPDYAVGSAEAKECDFVGAAVAHHYGAATALGMEADAIRRLAAVVRAVGAGGTFRAALEKIAEKP